MFSPTGRRWKWMHLSKISTKRRETPSLDASPGSTHLQAWFQIHLLHYHKRSIFPHLRKFCPRTTPFCSVTAKKSLQKHNRASVASENVAPTCRRLKRTKVSSNGKRTLRYLSNLFRRILRVILPDCKHSIIIELGVHPKRGWSFRLNSTWRNLRNHFLTVWSNGTW